MKPKMMNDKILKNFSPTLNQKQVKTVISLMRDGRLTDSKLKEILGLKSVSAAARHRKNLEKQGIVEGYTAIIDWEKVGYKTKFMVMIEGKDKEAFHKLEKNHILVIDEYLKKMGDTVILPVMFGSVLLKEVLTYYGIFGVIIGFATSEEAARNYAEVYLKQIHPNIKAKLFLVKDVTIKDFFIQRKFIEQFKKMAQITAEDKRFLDEIRKKISWERI